MRSFSTIADSVTARAKRITSTRRCSSTTGARPSRGQYAATLHCPWLVCIAADDRIALPGPAIEAALRAPKGELRIYPDTDHFDIYDGPVHEAVAADEIEFLHRHLLGRKLLGAPKASTMQTRAYLTAKTAPDKAQ